MKVDSFLKRLEKLPYILEIQYFGGDPDPNGGGQTPPDPNGGGQTPPQQMSFEPKFGMTEFTQFLAENADAQALLSTKIQAAVLAKQEELKPTLLEEAKKLLEAQSQKPAWQVETEALRAEIAKKEQLLALGNIKSNLTARLTNSEISGLTPEAVHEFCLKDTEEDSNKAFDALLGLIKSASQAEAQKELERRSKGYAYQPMNGGAGGQSKQESTGVTIARQIAQSRVTSNKRADNARSHFFNQ